MNSRVPLVLVAVALLSGCASGERAAFRNTGPNLSSGARPESASAPRANRPAAKPAQADYRLAPRDQIVFEMFNDPDVQTTQRLSSRGEMTLPLVGAVTLSGMTLREAEQEVRQRYIKGGYYVDPHVILSVAEYGAHYVQVLGQVNRPDRIEMPIEASSIGLVEAITQAGGFTRVARTDAVQVTRRTTSGTERHITIDVRRFLGRSGDAHADEFQLLPGDVVFVPERLF